MNFDALLRTRFDLGLQNHLLSVTNQREDIPGVSWQNQRMQAVFPVFLVYYVRSQ
jgi:hypothetical protein